MMRVWRGLLTALGRTAPLCRIFSRTPCRTARCPVTAPCSSPTAPPSLSCSLTAPPSRHLSSTAGRAPARALGYVRCVNDSSTRLISRWLASEDMDEPGGVAPRLKGVVEGVDRCLEGLDSTQTQLMEEECILIDRDDRPVGAASKKVCHLMTNIDKGMLHRAFSVFLFNTRGELLIQQRAPAKITFPCHWTNTCCSHPLSHSEEREEGGVGGAVGVLRAAQRKLKHELGIEPHQVPLAEFHYLTRVHYRSPNAPHDGGVWGEHEIDYILLAQRDVTLAPNHNEVMDQRYVNRDQLHALIERAAVDESTLITPWFKLIADHFLSDWWNKLDDLSACADHATIHRMC